MVKNLALGIKILGSYKETQFDANDKVVVATCPPTFWADDRWHELTDAGWTYNGQCDRFEYFINRKQNAIT